MTADVSLTGSEVIGVILAGGASRRFGSNKAFAVMPDGRTMIEHVHAALSKVCGEVVISTASTGTIPVLPSTRVLVDDVPGLGPLGALATALRHLDATVLLAACDTPLLAPKLLDYMMDSARGYDAVVLHDGQKLVPLPGVYRLSCLPAAESCLRSNERSLKRLCSEINSRTIGPDEWRRFDAAGQSLLNVNRTQDLAFVDGAVSRLRTPLDQDGARIRPPTLASAARNQGDRRSRLAVGS